MIAIENLVKRHGAREVLHGVSLEARPGRVTGFVGPNGAGKSSTLRCLLGLDRADGGRALIGGRPYRELREPLRTGGAMLDGWLAAGLASGLLVACGGAGSAPTANPSRMRTSPAGRATWAKHSG